MKKESKLETELSRQLELAKIPFLRGVKAIPSRRFEWDFQVKDLLIECQGGIWGKGGHSTGVGITRDAEKVNLATLEGYSPMVFTKEHIFSGQALLWVQAYLGRK